MSRLCVLGLGLLALPFLLFPACALADGETVYVVEERSVDDLRSDVGAVSGEVSSVGTSLTTYYQLVDDELSSISSQVDGVAVSQVSQGDKLDKVADDVSNNTNTLSAINDHLQSQDAAIESVQLAVDARSAEDSPQRMDFADVMALVPEDAPAELVTYMSYPFLWGMAAGIFGYLLSIAISAAYRLMGLR